MAFSMPNWSISTLSDVDKDIEIGDTGEYFITAFYCIFNEFVVKCGSSDGIYFINNMRVLRLL